MPNHMSAIGFLAATPDAFADLADQVVENGAVQATAGGGYICWAAGDGAELWAGRDAAGRLTSLQPHFSGPARRQVRLVDRRPAEGPGPGAGAFYAWANPPPGGAEDGDYPFVFAVPDFARHAGLRLPALVTVQLAAFADEVEAFPDDRAAADAQRQDPGLAAESFIPSGLFPPAPAGGAPGLAAAYALLSGHVLATAQRTNRATGAPFLWALVQTFGGALDLVADPATVRGTLVPGGVVQASVWLSGQLRAEASGADR